MKQFNETKSLEVIDFNEKLDPVNQFEPETDNGTFITWRCNKQGDMFIGWLNESRINLVKYDANKKMPSGN